MRTTTASSTRSGCFPRGIGLKESSLERRTNWLLRYERSKANGNWTRFSPHQQPSLGDPLGSHEPGPQDQEGRRMSDE